MNINTEFALNHTSHRLINRAVGGPWFVKPRQSLHATDGLPGIPATIREVSRAVMAEPQPAPEPPIIVPATAIQPPSVAVGNDLLAKFLYWSAPGVNLYCGNALEVMPLLPAASIGAVITSPPYAEQRKHQYGGISEHRYPVWTANWFMAVEQALCQDASILVNIREHIRKGQISDYVHKTRLLLREIGFNECEELIWIKRNGPPLGSTNRPRRCWERIMWFGLTGHAYCNPKANGIPSNKIGFMDANVEASKDFYHGYSNGFAAGISRAPDYVEVPVGLDKSGRGHPAPYPVALAEWLVRGWSPPNSTVLDPFLGSGSTGVAAVQNGRKFIGIELQEKYCAISKQRIEAALQARVTNAPRP